MLGDLPEGPVLGSSWWQAEADLRTEVHQATGLILSMLGLPADPALLRLRASAFVQSQTVRQRAQEILTHRHLTESDL